MIVQSSKAAVKQMQQMNMHAKKHVMHAALPTSDPH